MHQEQEGSTVYKQTQVCGEGMFNNLESLKIYRV